MSKETLTTEFTAVITTLAEEFISELTAADASWTQESIEQDETGDVLNELISFFREFLDRTIPGSEHRHFILDQVIASTPDTIPGIASTSITDELHPDDMPVRGDTKLRLHLASECHDPSHVFTSPASKGRCDCGRWLIAVAKEEA